MVLIGTPLTSVSFVIVEREEMFDINAWLAENANYQSESDVMSNAGMDHFEILLVLAYMVENHYINPEKYSEWDVSRWLEKVRFQFFTSKEAYVTDVLMAMEERIPAGVSVNWNATANYFLTDTPHHEFENGSIAVWEDN